MRVITNATFVCLQLSQISKRLIVNFHVPQLNLKRNDYHMDIYMGSTVQCRLYILFGQPSIDLWK